MRGSRARSSTGRCFEFIGDVLRDNLAPPDVQAAIFRALPMIPGVQLQRDAEDAAGRHGVAFARVHDRHIRVELILDPRTYEYLGLRQTTVRDFVARTVTFRGKKVEPHVARGTIFDWQARTAAAIVDRAGQRPDEGAPGPPPARLCRTSASRMNFRMQRPVRLTAWLPLPC
jgi:hypothetical protein